MASEVQEGDCDFIDSIDSTKSIGTSFFVVNFSSIKGKPLDGVFSPATYEITQGDSSGTRNVSADRVWLSKAKLNLTRPTFLTQKGCAMAKASAGL